MLPAFAAVVVASLLGSLHCAGMCGPLAAFAIGGSGGRAVKLHAAYHLSRGLGYALLGVAAGTAGRLVDLAGVLAGLQPLAAALAGATLAVVGLAILVRHLGGRIPHFELPERLAGPLRRLQQRAFRLPPTARAVAIGATTTLLPCGWLYAFAVTAAGTASPLLGGLVMVAFWLGTLPVLSAVGAGVRGIAGRLGPRLRPVAGLFLVAAGLATLSGRIGLDSVAIASSAQSAALHAPADVPDPEATPACCAAKAAEEEAEG
ncbi:MAG: sulfite exporter TauE/SafE family protein [Planctomycetota bacterium]